MKEAVQNTSIETVKAAKLNVRVADETERKALRDAMAPKARATYLERAGSEGTRVLALYDEERKKLGF
jgi:C4-dicarboxylate-binding protein DctP